MANKQFTGDSMDASSKLSANRLPLVARLRAFESSVGSRRKLHNEAADAIEQMKRALERLVAANNCNYEVQTMRDEGLFNDAKAAIAKAS